MPGFLNVITSLLRQSQFTSLANQKSVIKTLGRSFETERKRYASGLASDVWVFFLGLSRHLIQSNQHVHSLLPHYVKAVAECRFKVLDFIHFLNYCRHPPPSFFVFIFNCHFFLNQDFGELKLCIVSYQSYLFQCELSTQLIYVCILITKTKD